MKTIMTIVLSLLISIAFGQTEEKYDKYYDSLVVMKKYDELINFFEKELKEYPNSEFILKKIGHIYFVKDSFDLGEKYYQQALALNPQCAKCYLNIGGAYYTLKNDKEKALEYFDKAVNADPKDAALYYSRATLKAELADKFGALRDFKTAIEIKPNEFKYHLSRGLYHSNLGYKSLAIVDFTKVIELAPQNYTAYFERSSIYFEEAMYKEALKDMNKAIELDSNQSSSYIGRGVILSAMEEYKGAIKDYDKAVSLDKDNFLPYFNRAMSFYKLENQDACCADYFTLKSLIDKGKIVDEGIISKVNRSIIDVCDSTKPSYYYQRGVGLYNLEEYQKAIKMYAKGLKKFPQNSMTLTFKGNAHLAVKEYEQAMQCYNLSLAHKENLVADVKNNPNFMEEPNDVIIDYCNGVTASSHYSLSECKVNLNLLDEALIEINKAIEIMPNIKRLNKEAYYNMRGVIYLMKGEPNLAIKDFNESIRIDRAFPLAYINRAIAKLGLIKEVKITSFSLQGNFKNQPIGLSWNNTTQPSPKEPDSNILSALQDCNIAIEMDDKSGDAYYIRGQIKQMLAHEDYCMDLFTAKGLGILVDEELMKKCNN